ncbi:MAG: DUF6442 family protein [Defluviitaleaceae bacterium]|nr:DUF6442 family protein [Defluviitaleaceae bacterium]
MKKEDILAKSKADKRDEGMEHTENKGRVVGFAIFFCMAMVFQLSVMFLADGHHRDVMTAITALLFTFFVTESFAKWRFTRDAGQAFVLFVCILVVIVSTIAFFVHILGAGYCCECLCECAAECGCDG